MPRQRRDEEPEERYEDLDQMVLAEFESLDRPRRGPLPKKTTSQQAKVHPIAKSTPAPEPTGYFGEEAEVLQQALEEPLEGEDACPEDDILSPEEHAFVTRSVGFLRGRANADAILGRVWEEVTEGDPQAFFSPAEETSADEAKSENPAADTE
jgi:hypothetical protein